MFKKKSGWTIEQAEKWKNERSYKRDIIYPTLITGLPISLAPLLPQCHGPGIGKPYMSLSTLAVWAFMVISFLLFLQTILWISNNKKYKKATGKNIDD